MTTECWSTGHKSKKKVPGKSYIINIEKGESRWGLIPHRSTPLPIGWEANYSIKSRKGVMYYSNSEEKRSQWEVPTEKDTQLPENWVTKESSGCKQIYYYNVVTGKSQWKFPKPSTPPIVDGRKSIMEETGVKSLLEWTFPKPSASPIVDGRKLLSQETEKLRIKALLDAERRKQALIEERKSQNEIERILKLDEEERKQRAKALLEGDKESEKTVQLILKSEEKERPKMLADMEIEHEKLKKQDTLAKGIGHVYDKKAIYNPDNVQINWISLNREWELSEPSGKKVKKNGQYIFNPDTLEITTDVFGRDPKISTVMIRKCNASKQIIKEFLQFVKKPSHTIPPQIKIVLSNIQDVIQDQDTSRHKMFVLPSQLNGAEYLSEIADNVVIKLQEYIKDYTGGPRGQLAADPGVAQFIIDNAFNEKLFSREDGINNVKQMGIKGYIRGDRRDDIEKDGIYLLNGYLRVKSTVDVNKFIDKLSEMTIMGVKDVPVRGLDKTYTFIKDKDKVDTVDLVYASAVPISDYGNGNSTNLITIANLTLFSQYVGAMRLSILRQNCDLYLMPLGGNAFHNDFEHIKAAIIMAYTYMRKELEDNNVNVKVLVWEGDDSGRGAEERKAFGV
jgi:hypothetical protein